VLKGAVSIDETVCKSPDLRVDDDEHRFSAEGRLFVPMLNLYLMMNKPLGVVSSTKDPQSSTVLDLLPEKYKRPKLFPAGRLDKYSEGLMILTDDGDFAHRMLSPKHHVPKSYEVEVDAPVVDERLAEVFAKGAYLGGGQTASPARLQILSPTSAIVTIHEGLYHQVRRMFDQNGAHVTRLVRVAIGNLSLDPNLKPGQTKILTERERMLVFTAK
jgi:16S rRNA pseudouridine516 synthase